MRKSLNHVLEANEGVIAVAQCVKEKDGVVAFHSGQILFQNFNQGEEDLVLVLLVAHEKSAVEAVDCVTARTAL